MSLLSSFLLEPFQYGFMQRGLLTAVVLSASGGLLGSVLVLRRLALMGDVLTHSLLPGVAVAWLFFGQGMLAMLAGAIVTGVLTAVASGFVSRLTRLKEDAAFAALFLVAYAGGVALVSRVGTRMELLHFLFGNVLAVGPQDVALASVVALLTVSAFLALYRGIVLEVFDPVFARTSGLRLGWFQAGFFALSILNLVAAMQTMGVILALGLFLLPAITAYLWCDRFAWMLCSSVAIGATGSAIGLLLSYHTGLSSGPAIVLCLGAGFLMSAVASPHYGILRSLAQAWRERRTIRHTVD
jgi:zinc/manganese transport system permease protein